MKVTTQSLRGLTIVFLALFLVTTGVVGFGIYQVTLARLDSLIDQRIEDENHEIAPSHVTVGRAELVRRISDLTKQRETADLGVLLTDRDGRMIAGNTAFVHRPPLGFSSLDQDDQIAGLSSGRVLVRNIGAGMQLAVFAESEPIDNYFAARRRIYIVGFGAIVLVVLGGVLVFRRIIGRRIDAMRRTAESIIEGDLSRRVPVFGHGDEFDQQAAAFNRMLDRIAQLMGEIRNVSDHISHEMRTPLARLRNELALLERREAAQPIREELQVACLQADLLLEMFAAMLRIAEIESGSRRAAFALLDVGALCEEMVEMVQPLADERGQRVVLEGGTTAGMGLHPGAPRLGPVAGVGPANGPGPMLAGDRQLLSQLILNLLENALRHTSEGTTVRLRIDRLARDVVLTVADDGPGIPIDQRALVMRRFGRLDRSNGQAGHGLGLPLADAIARLHRGTMRLEDAAPGLRILVTLPE